MCCTWGLMIYFGILEGYSGVKTLLTATFQDSSTLKAPEAKQKGVLVRAASREEGDAHLHKNVLTIFSMACDTTMHLH